MHLTRFAILGSACVVFFLNGCATHEPMTRQEYLDSTTRTYKDVTKDEFFEEARKLFELNDESDYNFSYQPDRMTARNNWMIYAVFSVASGTDTWQLTTEETQNGLKTSVNVATSGSATAATPTGGGGVQTTRTGAPGRSPEGPAVFKLFWNRMDYLLGKNEEWRTCEEMDKKVRQGETWGLTDALCRVGTTNKLPEEIRKAQEAKRQKAIEEGGTSPSGAY